MLDTFLKGRSKLKTTIIEYTIITVSILFMAVGTCVFKFPNNFSFGGITGYATVVSRLTHLSNSTFINIANIILLILGFITIGKKFGIKTVYASLLLSVSISLFEKYFHISKPLTDEPLLELIFAIIIPGIASAILFNIGASSGGTDIVAMIIKKYTSLNIGAMLFLADFIAILISFFIFSPKTALLSFLGLSCKSIIIDSFIESFNTCKCFTIICEEPDIICEYIINKLHRSATTYEAQGAFAHRNKTIILSTMKRMEALRLRNFVRKIEPHAFIIITSSSEIIGKGFLNN